MPLVQHRATDANICGHVDGDDRLEPKSLGGFEVPQPAPGRPGMLVIYIRVLLPQPIFENVEIVAAVFCPEPRHETTAPGKGSGKPPLPRGRSATPRLMEREQQRRIRYRCPAASLPRN